jgi:RHS repeat-associated protein
MEDARPFVDTLVRYRYGFNGKETDPETGIQDYGMRWYLPNIARFPSVDPLTAKYPSWSPYPFAMNSPIAGVDLDGLEFYYAANGTFLGQGDDKKNKDEHEAMAIASTTMNFIEASKTYGLNYELEDVLAVKGYSSAIGNEDFNRYLDQGWSNNYRNVNGAVINALLGGVDYSNGAIQWDGQDFAFMGTEHSHYKDTNVDKTHYETFAANIKDYWTGNKLSGRVKTLTDKELQQATVGLTSSATYGLTIFWKLNPDSAQDGKHMVSQRQQTEASAKRLGLYKKNKK